MEREIKGMKEDILMIWFDKIDKDKYMKENYDG